MTRVRLQKLLAETGLGSRRHCERLIRQGRVTVNGVPAGLGKTLDPEHDVVRVDGVLMGPPEEHVYIALYKPVGVVSSARGQGSQRTAVELVGESRRVYPAGRLDIDSEGLLFLTNDGDLAARITHPRYGHEKEYRVLLDQRPVPGQIRAWARGVVLADGRPTGPVGLTLGRSTGEGCWIRVVMREGRKRQIRETAKALGLHVRRIIRTRIGGLRLGSLKPGEWRRLDVRELKLLSVSGSGPRVRARTRLSKSGVGRT